MMYAVHLLAKAMPAEEYGLFGVLLALVMCIPTMPLQMVLAQQTARALATGRERELSGMIRLVWIGTSVLWAVACVGVWLFQERILRRWGITNPAALWVTIVSLLFALWTPMFAGVLQGKQNFMWLGWSMIAGGVGRLAAAALAVIALSWYAVGMMTGVLLGVLAGVAISIWHSRLLWLVRPAAFDWRALLAQVVPLMLGFGAFQFVFTADTMFVKAYFPGDQTGFYFSAGTLSRALMWFVGPMASVMFPKIVHSAAKSEKTDLMGLVLTGTAILAVLGAVATSVLGPWIVRIVYGESYVQVATSVLPWYVGAMVPLAVANVLLNNLLARSAYKLVLPLCVLAIAYGFALTQFHDTLVTVLKTLGVCNLFLLGICAWFTWVSRPGQDPRPGEAGAAVR
jgi:O-antigen/teichoic acid export membrane protein